MGVRLNLNENIIENSVQDIQNPYLKQLFVLTRIKQEISDCCLEEYDLKIAPFQEKRMKERLKRIEKLKEMGLKSRDNNMSFYLNYLSPGCLYCKMGFGPTISLTLDCNRNCFYCFQYRPQNIKRKIYRSTIVNVDNEIQWLKNNKFEKNIINLGISGGEPLLVLDKVLESIKVVKQRKRIKSITRLYTNGDLLNEDILKKLKDVGLDEIRFGIRFGEFGMLQKIILAKKYIPRILMEGPIFPESEKFMKDLLLELNRIKIFGINLLDLRGRHNIGVYKKGGYLFAYKEKRPFYERWEDEGWPIYGSEEVIFNLLEFAIQKNLSMSVHYCPIKQNIYVSHRNTMRIAAFSKKHYCEAVTKNGLLRKIVIYFPNHLEAVEDLKKHGVSKREINISSDNKRLETHLRNLKHLNLPRYEIGVLDTLPGGEEVNIEVIKSKAFCNVLTKNTGMYIRNDPHLIHIGKSIASIYFQKKSEKTDKTLEVIDVLKKGLEILPDSSAIYLGLAIVYFNLKHHEEAIKKANKLIELDYKEDEVYSLLGFCYEKTKKYKKAIKELRKAEKIGPEVAQINFSLSNCYRNIGQIEQANRELDKGFIKLKKYKQVSILPK